MKVLHISGARSWGGNEQQLIYLIQELKKYNVVQSLFCYESTPLFEIVQNLDIQVIAIPYIKPHKKGYRESLKKTVVAHSFDLLHLHTSDSVTGYVLTDLLKGLKTKTVFSKKGVSRKVSFLSKQKYNYRNIDKILCVSKVVYEHFREVLYVKNHSKLCVVYDGVQVEDGSIEVESNIREELNLPEEIKVIGNIANHTKAKDLKTLIKTLDVLVNKKHQKDIHLVQMGEFSKRTQELKDMVLALGLEKYITFVGFRKKASSFLPQFDIYLMTSEREGGPTTVLEAFYKKVAVVSTRVGVVGEAITDGENGFVTSIGDYASLADKIEVLIKDHELKSTFAERSFQNFLNLYTTEKLGAETFKVYREVLN
ncbi:glycosyltransferase [Aquimarina spongiae]|uniref:Glycosyltransferase involved in cell wall bisynthesis n=1 Tax=Aquimarina spongiae TaxID=570521 RepID=A0A1M6K282_9FLAO|nr:glycosyltransferase [Aquimarina spongiae]SHJ53010.1 Glycosyltransferase involved in cell wall bisynthesis [Aquimarina spongiae]